MRDSKADSEKFISWFISSEAELSSSVNLVDRGINGVNRCIIAVDNIEEGEVLFSLPRNVVLNVRSSDLTKDNFKIRECLLSEIGDWEGLVICLYYELRVLKEKSRWWPYLKMLPLRRELDSLMYWSEEEIAKLRPSFIVSRIGKESAQKMYDRVISHVSEWDIESLKQMTWDEFLYVASIIMAYSFDSEQNSQDSEAEEVEDSEMQTQGGYIKCMIPMADMLNSDTKKVNANLVYDGEVLRMVATKNINADEQIYNIYGEFSNAEILRRYGYVEQEGSKYDFGEIELNCIVNVISECHKVRPEVLNKVLKYICDCDELSEEEIILPSYDCYIDGKVASECVFVLQFLTSIADTIKEKHPSSKELSAEVRKLLRKILKLLQSGRITRSASDNWKTIIKTRLGEYPQSLVGSTPCPTVDPNAELSVRRLQMAECVLKSEIRSLQTCADLQASNYNVIEDADFFRTVSKRSLNNRDEKTEHAKKKK